GPATGKEDPELPLLQRISSLELPVSVCNPNKCFTEFNRHISTSTVQRRLCESGLYGRSAAKKVLLKDTNYKKRLAGAKKHKQYTLDLWKSVFVRVRVGELTISCVVPTMKHGGDVMVWGCFAGDTVRDLFRIPGTLNQPGYHNILQQYAIPSGLHLLGLSFVFQQDNDKHTSRLCKGFLAKKEGDGVLHQMTWPPQSVDLNPIN
uniref:Transposase Tc1-like domain-containing protein n=1 Tax=Oncorhynchus tshawytscha TaxID=74940 RepID=A0AAZ3SPW2_ONCTS